jgi:PAS domain-containing protein
VLIGKLLDLHKIEAASLADTLDGLAAAVFLVDANGAIVRANASGQAMLAKGDAVRAVGNRLTLNQRGREQALTDICTAAEAGDAIIGTKGIAVPFESPQGTHYVANVLPLTSGGASSGQRYSAVAAVFVAGAGRQDAASTRSQIYQLGAELRVLFSIVDRRRAGGRIRARHRRDHGEPAALFEKTGTDGK